MKALGLGKSFGKRVLFSDFSFEASKGLVLARGPSGCGKSTFLRIVMGLIKPDRGAISFGGFSYEGKSEKELSSFRAANFAYVGDLPSLLYGYSLKDNLQVLVSGYQKNEAEKIERELGYGALERPLYHQSGGERRKAELVAALLKKAPVLILDEPFANLDVGAKKALSGLIEKEAKERLVFLVSHDAAFVPGGVTLAIDFPSNSVVSLASSSGPGAPAAASPDRKKLRRLVLKDEMRQNRLKNIAVLALTLLSGISLVFGLSLLDSRSALSNLEVGVGGDPFGFFSLSLYKQSDPLDYHAFIASSADGYEIYEAEGPWSAVSFVSEPSLSGHDDTLFVDPAFPNDLGLSEGTAVTLSEASGDVSLTVSTDYSFPESRLCRYLADAKNGKTDGSYVISDRTVLFLSPETLESILSVGGFGSLSVGGSALSDPTIIYEREDGTFSFRYDQQGYSPMDVEIDGASSLDFSFPGVEKGGVAKIKDTTGGVSIDVPATTGNSDGKVHVGPGGYRYLAYLSGQYGSHMDHGTLYSPVLSGESIVSFVSQHPGYSAQHVTICNYESARILAILFLAFGGGLLVLTLFMAAFSGKGVRSSWARLDLFFRMQGYSPSARLACLSLPPLIGVGLAMVASLLAYGFGFLPLADLLFLKLTNSTYSEEPLNSYYDAVARPLPFAAFNGLSLLLLLIPFVFAGAIILTSRFSQRK